MSRTCQQQTIAKNEIARIDRCTDCGAISLHFGPLSVRIDEHVLEALSSALGEAMAVLRYSKPGTEYPRPRIVD